MGTYVYALSTKVHNVSGVTLGVAEFRYKEHFTSFDDDRLNASLYNRRCKTRVEHFKKNKLPFYFIMSLDGRMEEGFPVYSMQLDNGKTMGACFDDCVPRKKVGILVKKGRSWTIKWDIKWD